MIKNNWLLGVSISILAVATLTQGFHAWETRQINDFVLLIGELVTLFVFIPIIIKRDKKG